MCPGISKMPYLDNECSCSQNNRHYCSIYQKIFPVVFHLKVTISGVVHSVGYEITFFAVNPAPIATNPITKIHLDPLPERNLFIKFM